MSPASHIDVNRGSEIADLSLAAAVQAVRESDHSASTLLEAALARIEAREPETAAFAYLMDEDQARRRAYVADRVPVGKRGLLHGIPIAVGATIDVSGMKCERGAALYRGRTPSEDAAVVATIRDAGAIVVGTASVAEFGCFGSGTARNPYDTDRSAGGAGAAVAVATGMVPFAIDARPDGSIPRSAAYCGIYGMNTARGTIVGDGIVSHAPSMETSGFYVREAVDLSLVCNLLLDAKPIPELRDELTYRTEGLNVCLMEGPFSYRIAGAGRSAINRAMTALSDARVETTLSHLSPRFMKLESCVDTILGYEVAQHLGPDRDRLAAKIGPVALACIDHGRRIGANDYEQARRDTIALRRELLDMLTGETVFLGAASEGYAPLLSEEAKSPMLQALWALAGVPTLSVPCGTVDGLPVGVQIAAAPGREDLLVRVACMIEDHIITG